MRPFYIVVAADRNRGIGKDGGLPWKLPADMAYFKNLTTRTQDPAKHNAVIMGRKTWQSIPPPFRPLKGRLNVVLSRAGLADGANSDQVVVAGDLERALELSDRPDIESVFVIGGGTIYEEALKHPLCSDVYLTEIDAVYECDTFLPPLADLYRADPNPAAQRDGDVGYRFAVYRKAK